jgi:hypothetical protein
VACHSTFGWEGYFITLQYIMTAMTSDAMTGGVKYMRALKVARSRREMSPDQFQMALHTALMAIPGMSSYGWRKSFCNRGHPSVRIVVLLGCGYRTAAAVQAVQSELYQQLHDMFALMCIVVTHNSRVFRTLTKWTMRASC